MNHSDDYFKNTFDSLHDTFRKSATGLVEVMFGTKAISKEPWIICNVMDGTFDYIFRLISKNSEYKSNTIIGASMKALQKVMGDDCTLEDAKDAFGEYANCYNALLMEEPQFIERFGLMRQEVPEDATTLACFPIAWGIQGLLHFDAESIFMRFSIEDRKFSSELLESLS
jgi:hypothetical protein